jgi:hypothetical protein
MKIVFGALGILGGLLCLSGNLLLDCKGQGNETLGKYKFIESNWDKMSEWRFKTSTLFAAVGVPLYFLGFTSLAMQITDKQLSIFYWIACVIGSVGGVFIHGLLCIFPVLYKMLLSNCTFEDTENVLNVLYHTIKIPFFFHYAFLVIIPSILVGCALICNYLSLPIWFIVFTHMSTMLIGLLLKSIFKRDFPGITSFGIAMAGLMAIINYNMSICFSVLSLL